MKKKNKILLIISVAIIAVGTIGILTLVPRLNKAEPDTHHIPQEETITTEDEAENTPIVSIWHQFDENTPEERYLTELVDGLQLQLTDYSLDIRTYQGTEMRNQLLAAKQSDSFPTLVFVDPEMLPELIRLDILSTLDTRDEYQEVSNRLLDRAIETGRKGEHHYGLPFSITLHTHNTNSDDEHPSETAGFDIMNIAPILWSNGGELMSPDQSKATGYLDSRKNIEIIVWGVSHQKKMVRVTLHILNTMLKTSSQRLFLRKVT